ncbi:hypothetical protein M404DRAFT_189208 [Pisolithus tinctorius Marx 270]|uniref:Uncharacterized protein n=1 Tax=Pisolithus tinctorius Marx 270 TaxID=870435 RepID=A0A0C3PYR9_PISTI|nr:hypothetical protein M404DRAFT_189208 [Pisolithus tinctorius Marx 270]
MMGSSSGQSRLGVSRERDYLAQTAHFKLPTNYPRGRVPPCLLSCYGFHGPKALPGGDLGMVLRTIAQGFRMFGHWTSCSIGVIALDGYICVAREWRRSREKAITGHLKDRF